MFLHEDLYPECAGHTSHTLRWVDLGLQSSAHQAIQGGETHPPVNTLDLRGRLV